MGRSDGPPGPLSSSGTLLQPRLAAALEMMFQNRPQLRRSGGIRRFRPVPEFEMKACAPPRCLAPIKNLTVHRIAEGLSNRALVGRPYRIAGRTAQDAMAV